MGERSHLLVTPLALSRRWLRPQINPASYEIENDERVSQYPSLVLSPVEMEYLSNVKGKRVCVLGSGDNQVVFALAGLGAHVTSVDIAQGPTGRRVTTRTGVGTIRILCPRCCDRSRPVHGWLQPGLYRWTCRRVGVGPAALLRRGGPNPSCRWLPDRRRIPPFPQDMEGFIGTMGERHILL